MRREKWDYYDGPGKVEAVRQHMLKSEDTGHFVVPYPDPRNFWAARPGDEDVPTTAKIDLAQWFTGRKLNVTQSFIDTLVRQYPNYCANRNYQHPGQPDPNARGGNNMARDNSSIDARLATLAREELLVKREIDFLSSFPEEPEVSDGVEPTVLLVNRLHPDSGAIVTSTVIVGRMNQQRYGSTVVTWTSRGDGEHGGDDWVNLIRHLYSCDAGFEIRQLNPGVVVYTTMPPVPAPKRPRTARTS